MHSILVAVLVLFKAPDFVRLSSGRGHSGLVNRVIVDQLVYCAV